jgi:integrin beta 3
MTETEALADVVALCIHDATEPLIAKNRDLEHKIAVLEARPAGYGTKEAWDALQDTLSDLRTRLMTVEGRAPVPGPQGSQGERGVSIIGPAGNDGAVGPAGPAGERGPMGEVGQRGPMGEKGDAGLNGKDGRDGIDGKDGAPGLNGKDGAPGLNGKDGTDGLHGKDGRDGLDGKDGAPGLAGKDGAIGLTGEKGANGRDGLPGVPGRWGDKGDPGVPGKDGRDGLNGKDGSDGLNGKDGLGFDDLVFDEQKGWLLKSADRELAIPLPFDADVWRAGRVYPKGAGTTVNGAWWIAREATMTRPGDGSPESAKAWRLAVKGGKDGKQGPQGPAGQDWAP